MSATHGPEGADFTAEGGCTCWAVRWRLSCRPLFVHCCHCRWCQRESGASFALKAMIEAEFVTLLTGQPEIVRTPTNSGRRQKVARCPQCRVAQWSNNAGAGDAIHFVRVGTLDQPDLLPPQVHIFTSSKQPWVILPAGVPAVPAVPEYYDRKSLWPADSLAWREFNGRIGTSGAVGIWHETYFVKPGQCENVYVNMPAFGLGRAGTVYAAEGVLRSAVERLGAL